MTPNTHVIDPDRASVSGWWFGSESDSTVLTLVLLRSTLLSAVTEYITIA